MKLSGRQLRRDALAILQAALNAADAAHAVQQHFRVQRGLLSIGDLRLRLSEFDRIFLVAAGKASVPMAAAIERTLRSRLTGGIAVTKYGHVTARLERLKVYEASHPTPDAAGLRASEEIQRMLSDLNARDLLLVAVSGGASALLVAPQQPITLESKQKTTDLLLLAGADIFELNTVRKHLSALKGGKLAALAYPATVVSLLLSDVIGDPLDVIGSGPTAPDSSTFADAIAVLEKFALLDRVPHPVRTYLERGASGDAPETPKPGQAFFKDVHNFIIGSNRLALEAAAREARKRKYRTLILSSSMQGETRHVARVHAHILREVQRSGHPVAAPACILSGGETTVTVKGKGKGGRNQEFALAAAIEIAESRNMLVLSAGTDGTDGPTDAAGAIATGNTVRRALEIGFEPQKNLQDNDSYPVFEALGDLIKTGPTGTNVMDVHMLLAG